MTQTMIEKLVDLQKEIDRTEGIEAVVAVLTKSFTEMGLHVPEGSVTFHSANATFWVAARYEINESKFELCLRVIVGVEPHYLPSEKDQVDPRFQLMINETQVVKEQMPELMVVYYESNSMRTFKNQAFFRWSGGIPVIIEMDHHEEGLDSEEE